MNIWLTGVLMGLAGTLAMDFWAVLLNKVAGQNLPNWAMPGRWFGHVFQGKVFHDDIGAVAPVSGELSLGWMLHYGVGVIYGVFWALIAGNDWLMAPTFLPVWIFALLTISAGWFLLQPGMGLGWAASKTDTPWKARGMGLLAHTVFGLGMWLAAIYAV